MAVTVTVGPDMHERNNKTEKDREDKRARESKEILNKRKTREHRQRRQKNNFLPANAFSSPLISILKSHFPSYLIYSEVIVATIQPFLQAHTRRVCYYISCTLSEQSYTLFGLFIYSEKKAKRRYEKLRLEQEFGLMARSQSASRSADPSSFHGVPDGPFHNFGASKSVGRRF